jgi:hypothetical protein
VFWELVVCRGVVVVLRIPRRERNLYEFKHIIAASKSPGWQTPGEMSTALDIETSFE